MNFTFPDGSLFPSLGLGTWQAKGNDVYEAVKSAISLGYRHIDTAYVYENEEDVGKAINEKINDGTIKRSDIFVTTKLWCTFHQDVLNNIQISLKKLSLDYVDLYLIHWPMSFKAGDVLFPFDENKKIISGDGVIEDTWKAMEEVQKAGLAKNIGVSNFNPSQLGRVLKIASVHPVVNQFEAHPFLDNRDWIDYCLSNQVIPTAYSPFGSPARPWADASKDILFLEHETVKELAQKHGKSPSHILLRFHIQRECAVIPKSTNPAHMKSNFEIFDFEMDAEDMEKLNGLGASARAVSLEMFTTLKEYPF